MLRCREVTQLLSESMDRELPLRQRFSLWMHLAMCRLCSGFARHVRLLRRAARENPERLADGPSGPDAALSPDARRRIKAALRGGEHSSQTRRT